MYCKSNMRCHRCELIYIFFQVLVPAQHESEVICIVQVSSIEMSECPVSDHIMPMFPSVVSFVVSGMKKKWGREHIPA